MRETPGRISYQGVTLQTMLAKAHRLRPYQITGPAWIEDEHYDVVATLPEAASKDNIPEMLRDLLTVRFRIASHSEMKQGSIYLLRVEKGGAKLKPSVTDSSRSTMGWTVDDNGQAQMTYMAKTLSEFADILSIQLHRPVVDETGLSGKFDITLSVEPHDLEAGADSLPSSLLTSVKSIGLKLEPGKAPLKHLVIDEAQKIPLEN